MFNILRKWQIVFQNSSAILQSHYQCIRVPISSHLHQHLLFSFFKIQMKWYHIVVLICISWITNGVELLTCLLPIYMLSLEKCLFESNFYFVFLLLNSKSSLYILDTNPLSDTLSQIFSSILCGCCFTFLMVSFKTKFLKVWWRLFIYVIFWHLCFCCHV